MLRYVFIILFLLSFQTILKAEGTKEVSPTINEVASLYYSPTGYGSYFNCPADNRLNFVISDHTTENLYFGFRWMRRGSATLVNNMYYRIIDGSGTVVAGPFLCPTVGGGLIGTYAQAVTGPNIAGSAPGGYTPISFNPAANGTYYMELYRSSDGGASMNITQSAIAPFFDFTVATATGTRFPGRLYCKKWGLVAGNPGDDYAGATTDNVNPSFYTYTADSTVVKVSFDRFNPLAFNVAFNNYGVDPLQTDFTIGRRSIYSAVNPDLSGSFNTFLNAPDVNIFPSSPQPTAPTKAGDIWGCPGFYYFPYQTYASGDVRILLDLNGVAGYQSGTEDLYLFAYNVPAGLHTITWNGLDGLGNQVAVNAPVSIQLTTLRGRTNLPLYDPEYNLYGFTLDAVLPQLVPNLRMYWDDSQLGVISGQGANLNNSTGPGIANIDSGQVSPGHAWNGNYGPSMITTFPAPSNGGTGNATVGNLDDDFGNVRIINTWFWPVEESGAAFSVNIPNCTPAPDFNVTWVNVPVAGNVSSNDSVATGSTYGTAVALPGNPGPAVPVMNSNGIYTFTSAVPGVFYFNVPVCAPAQVPPCRDVLLTITVLDNVVVNNPPVANIDFATTNENIPVTLNTLGNDLAGNPGGLLVPGSVSITTQPANGSAVVNPATGEITYTPANGFTGQDTLYYSVCDNSTPALCASSLQIIMVQGVCDCTINTVVAVDDYAYTPFNTPVSGNVLLNDSDPEGDNLSVNAQTTTEPGAGTLVMNADGTWTFTPVPGFYGPVDFFYTACDDNAVQACMQATLHILVGPPVQEPNPDFNVTWVNVPVTGNVSTNDNVDPGSTYGTATAVPGNPGPAIPTINADGTYTFTSAVAGVFVFEVPVCYPSQPAPCTPVLLTITVLENTVVNNPPVANVDIATTNINTPVTLNTLANDAAGNPGGSLVPSTVAITANPSNGSASVNPATGEITYTPDPGFTGQDTLTYTVCDNSTPSLCATSIQIITVQPAFSPNSTVAADDYAYTPFNTPVSGNVILNDSDPEGDNQAITPQNTTVPGAGTLVLNADGTFTFTPVAGFSGPVELPYTVCDDNAVQVCTQATLHILVPPPSQNPNPDFNVTYVNVQVSGDVSTNDNVEPGSTYGTATAVPGNPGPATPSINSDGTYTFTSAVPGVFIFEVPVCYPSQTPPCPPVLLTITVLDNTVNSNPPVANVDIATTNINTPVTLNTLANDEAGNPGGSLVPSTVAVTANPSNGTATVNPATGEITYTPNPGFSGADTLTYTVCDNSVPALCATALQIITIQPPFHANTTAAADDYASTPFETPVSGNVIVNDTDAEGDNQTITPQTTTIPGSGTLSLNSDGTWTFSPETGFSGTVEFPYTVCDDNTTQACTQATLHIVVRPTSIVPLTLLSFKAILDNRNVKLSWDVTGEYGVDKHYIERSVNGGRSYETIGAVRARNTGLDDRYTYYDNLSGVRENVLYYRLRSADISGTQKLSHIEVIRLAKSGQIVVSPNPARESVKLSFYSNAGSNGMARLYNSTGQLVLQQAFTAQASGNQLVSINGLARLQTGTYLLKVIIGEEVFTERIIVTQ